MKIFKMVIVTFFLLPIHAQTEVVSDKIELLKDVTAQVVVELNDLPGLESRPGKAKRYSTVYDELTEAIINDPKISNEESKDRLIENTQMLKDCNFKFECDAMVEWLSKYNTGWLETLNAQAISDLPMLDINLNGQEKDHNTTKYDLKFSNCSINSNSVDLVLEREGDVHPKLIGINIPNQVIDSLVANTDYKLPFLIYLHPTLGQNLSSGYYIGSENLKSKINNQYYPYGWDFVFHGYYKYLSYFTKESFNIQYSIGIGTQVEHVGKPVITVIPILNPNDNINVGDFKNSKKMRTILLSISSFLNAEYNKEASPSLGRVAIASFSSSNFIATSIIMSDTKHLQSFVDEIYMFDAPASGGVSYINAANLFRANHKEKMVRIYSQSRYENIATLIGSANLEAGCVVHHKDNPNVSAGYFNKEYWMKQCKIIILPIFQTGN